MREAEDIADALCRGDDEERSSHEKPKSQEASCQPAV